MQILISFREPVYEYSYQIFPGESCITTIEMSNNRASRRQQGRRDSNPQPLGLEANTLAS